MKAFKTFIASAIAGAIVLSMATSAFAALTVDAVNTDSSVSASGAESVAGERTILVVSKSGWSGTAVQDWATILYINQVDNGSLADALADMAGKNLTHGDYVLLVGNENGTVESDAFTAIKVEANEPGTSVEGVTPVSWEVTMNSNLLVADTVKAKFYDSTDGYIEGTEKTLFWDENLEITGSGDFTFTAETSVSDEYVESTQLHISSGTVVGKN